MILIKKDLTKVKNELLCELEDYLFDIMIEFDITKMSEEDTKGFSQAMMKSTIEAIKENVERFAVICYEGEDGQELTLEDLAGIPLKIKIFKECMGDIMQIMGDYLEEGEEKPSGKPQVKKIKPR